MGPTPVTGERSISTAVTENVLGRGFGRGTPPKKRKKRPHFAAYKSAMEYTKTPETTAPAVHGGLKHLAAF